MNCACAGDSISDTFTEFAQPLMKKLGWLTIFLHSLW